MNEETPIIPDQQQKRGLKNLKNLAKWEGKKELFWIGFIVFIIFISWAYYRDTKLCREVIAKDNADWMKLTNGTGVISHSGGQANYPSFNFTLSDMNMTKNMNITNGT